MSLSLVAVPGERRGWVEATVAVGLLQLLAFADRFTLSLVAVPAAQALRLDDFQLGVLQGTAFIVPFAAATFVFGRLGDRVPARSLLLFGFALWTAATAWSGFVASAGDLYAARLLLAVGEAVVGPVGLALIARAAPAGRSSLATSLFSGAGPLGKGLALVGGGAFLALVAAHHLWAPWRTVFWASAALNVALAPAIWILLRRQAHPADPAVSGPADLDTRRGGLNWEVGLLGVAGCAAVLASQSLGAWTPTYLHRAFGLSVSRAGALAGAPLMLASPVAGLLMAAFLDARSGRNAGSSVRHAWALAFSLAVSGAAACVFLGRTAEAVAIAGFVVFASALGGAITAFLAAMQVRQPRARRAAFASWVVLVPNLVGFGVGPALTGYLSRGHGGSPESLRLALLTVLASACSLGVAAAAAAAWREIGRSRPVPRGTTRPSAARRVSI